MTPKAVLVCRAATLVGWAVGLVAGCATSGGAVAPIAPRTNLAAADLYPLDLGWKWAYDLEKDGQTMLAMYAVLERSPDTAVVQAGEDRLTYAISPEGIAQKDGPMIGDFVVRNPIRAGTEWPVAGGRARIAALGQSVTVTAGKFDDCVVVETTRADPVRSVRTTFAPGIGPVVIELQIAVGGQLTTVTRATLRALTKPGQDPLARSVGKIRWRARIRAAAEPGSPRVERRRSSPPASGRRPGPVPAAARRAADPATGW
jgi:hypothetical protein